MKITVTCPQCPHCKKSAVMELDALAFEVWRSGGLIQSCFPDIPKDEREQLLTGIHPKCWSVLFGESSDSPNKDLEA